MKPAQLVSAAICLALGLAGGHLMAGSRPAPAPRPAHAADAEALTRADVEAVVRAELQRSRAEAGLAGAQTPAAARPAPGLEPPGAAEAPESAEAAAEAAVQATRAERLAEIVDEALARGVWTDADREQLREHAIGLPAELAMPIMVRMNAAINSGELDLQTAGMPI